jgi:hypothetical protein
MTPLPPGLVTPLHGSPSSAKNRHPFRHSFSVVRPQYMSRADSGERKMVGIGGDSKPEWSCTELAFLSG